ncbi:spermine/spermidine synthase domain-containing protein [Anaeromicrobium sediminis]|uniref:Spermine synthase n=1 Tax=Anaeromicrobium sediminis TaxID=1478221 RepID=A0A267MII7_9FIRM|nr:spermidine synthase [Anaeromicrobium sediminis]PAB58613.1 hypothetical protein CCE28_14105 [Anaeromicrobium sediminis]
MSHSKTQNKIECSNRVYLYLAMFLIGFSLFLYEILLTRLFSVILSVNLVFLVVSFAILGSGIGGIYTYKILKANKKIIPEHLLKKYSVWIPISILLSIGAMYYLPFMKISILYALIGAISFVMGGIVISSMFKENEKNSNKLYFMDLVGSSLGSLAVIPLMNQFGFMRSVVVVCIMSLIASILIYVHCKEYKKMLILGLCSLLLGAGFMEANIIKQMEKPFNAYYLSPNTLISYLKDSKEKPKDIPFTKWDAISRTDVIETTNENEKIIVTDGGASAPIIKFDGNIKSIEHLKKKVNYIPFAFGNNHNTLVIGSGGGKDVLFALLGESENIDAVEINTSTIEAVNSFRDFSGDIYNRPEVNVYNQDGRNFIENSNKKYDNIYLSMVMTNAIENTMYSLSENYIYTYEAVEKYFGNLNENGKLSFMMHNNLDLLRVVNTGIEVLLHKGVRQENVTDYFIIVNGMDKRHKNNHKSNVKMPLVIFKSTPFTEEEINIVRETAKVQNREVIHYPGGENELYKLLKDKKITYEELLNKINFNVKSIKDDSPFFYNYTKTLPAQIQYVFWGILFIWFLIRIKYANRKEHKEPVKYFMGLGIAYMLVEIPTIQKMILYFGNPSLAFSVMLFSILVSSGIGSVLSGHKKIKNFTDKSPMYLLLTGIAIVIIQLNLSNIMSMTSDLDLI